MTNATLHSVTVTTDGTGAAVAQSDTVSGLLSQIRYVKNNFDNGSTITITSERTGATLWSESNVNASATRAPRQATHTTAGAAAVYAAADGVLDKIALVNDRAVVTIAAGGATKSGTFHLTFV